MDFINIVAQSISNLGEALMLLFLPIMAFFGYFVGLLKGKKEVKIEHKGQTFFKYTKTKGDKNMEQWKRALDELIKQGLTMEQAIQKIIKNPDDVRNILIQSGVLTHGLIDIIRAIMNLFDDPRVPELLKKYESIEKALEAKQKEIKEKVEKGGQIKL